MNRDLWFVAGLFGAVVVLLGFWEAVAIVGGALLVTLWLKWVVEHAPWK